MHFPELTTNDLNGDERRLPTDFAGTQHNLLFVAYQQWQQQQVDSWVPLAEELEARLDGFRYYELPVVGEMDHSGRLQLDFWMRTGIRDRETRARTLTLYVDRAAFRHALGIPGEAHIALLLLDGAGELLWQAEGPHSPARARALLEAIERLPA